MADYFKWRYLPCGRVKHALIDKESTSTAECGVFIWGGSWQWRGSGSYLEEQKLNSLPKCKRCLVQIGKIK